MRMTAPVLLATLLSAAPQATAAPPKFPQGTPYEELGRIYEECHKVYIAYKDESERIVGRFQAALRRKRSPPLGECVALLREWVHCADKAHAKGVALARRFELAYRKAPDTIERNGYRNDFYYISGAYKDLRQIRGRSRMMVYYIVCGHTWAWEPKWLGLKSRCLQLFAARCGFTDAERFLISIGEVEAAASDLAAFAKAGWLYLWTPVEPDSEPRPKGRAGPGKTPPGPVKP